MLNSGFIGIHDEDRTKFRLGHRKENEMDTKKKKEKSAHDMTDKEVAQSVDLEVSDFSDDGSDLDELRNIMEGND